MSKDQHTLAKSQAGFTLVELAIVMIIIGLLIAGVLKGQELITNAKTTSTVAQIKAIDAAVSSFKDQYGSLPGDLTTPSTRIPNCGTACTAANTIANGDGNIDSANSFGAAPGKEALAFFPELAEANLMTGLNDTSAAGSWGNTNPAAKIDTAGFMVGTVTAVATGLPGGVGLLGTPSGLYLALVGTATAPTAAPSSTNVGIQPKQANSIDIKLDDGVPSSGSVVALGTTTGTTGACTNGAVATSVYYSANATTSCGLYIRIQG